MRKFGIVTALTLALLQAGPGVAAEDVHHGHGTPQQLTLDHGRKWTADQHTADSAASMKSILDKAQPKAGEASVADLRAVGVQLQEQLQALIRGCTMTGPAHDQLHLWISSLAPEIQALAAAPQEEAGRASIGKLSQMLDSFRDHFETAPRTN